ncbi:MAG: alanine dehydrogenase, partial [Myxococcota bacterium]
MKIGVPKEIKNHEYRVSLVPAGAKALVDAGHTVLVEQGAGEGSAIPDAEYQAVGAQIVADVEEVWGSADMIMKVKEPLAAEYDRIQPGQTLYTYFHLAAVPDLAPVLLDKQVTAVAYETIQLPDGRLPLLEPMSEVAGRLSIQVGARCLERQFGGKGQLLGGVPGVDRGDVVIIGGGTVGLNAAKMAIGLGARTWVLDINLARLAYLDDIFGNRITTLHSNHTNLRQSLARADLVVGAVLVAGARAPKLVTEDDLKLMQDGSVVVDVSVDQGGCIATARPTTHENPTYMVHGIVHYCVANMPGAVARSSTFALTNTTIGYALKLAKHGAEAAARADKALGLGVNTFRGAVTH